MPGFTQNIVQGQPRHFYTGPPTYVAFFFGQAPNFTIRNAFWLAPRRPDIPMQIAPVQVGGVPLFPIAPSPATITPTRTLLESLLLTLYGAGIGFFEPADAGESLMLDASIQAAGRDSDYAGINVADFLVFFDAAERYFQKADGNFENILTLGPDGQRPPKPAIQTEGKTRDKMFRAIKCLGLLGLVKYLYADQAISFDEMKDLLCFFLPDPAERGAYIWGAGPGDPRSMWSFLSARFAPAWTQEERLELLESVPA